jgi:hypothetical protein
MQDRREALKKFKSSTANTFRPPMLALCNTRQVFLLRINSAASVPLLRKSKRNYTTIISTTTYSILNNISFEEFAHWFSGFCDAESNFSILDLKNRFSFYFNIKLHIDDIKVLQNISQKLKVGKIYIHKNTATFRISKYEELQKLFNILDIKPLNTTKYLNYIAFKEALLLYHNITQGSVSPVVRIRRRSTQKLSLTERSAVFDKIRVLKNSMNTLRINFVLPDSHKILITPY